MSAVIFWAIALTGYMLGAYVAAVACTTRNEHVETVLSVATWIALVVLIVLIGVLIGGAA